MVTPRTLIYAAAAGLVVACSSTDPAPSSSGALPPSDAGSAVDGSDASSGPYPILPYPPGPYSAEIGGVIADFRVQGYALSPSQRDSRVLPFRDITLAEVRSKPGCECLMIIWSAAGQNCNPCIEADLAMTAGMDRDPSLCVVEVLSTSFDTFGPTGTSYWQPPTRADLDAFTQSNRESYPVGLLTASVADSLGSGAINAIPAEYVVRTADMRLVAFILGRHSDLDREALRHCANPMPAVETLAANIAPRAIVADASDVYVADESRTILRVPLSGANVDTVSATAGIPEHIVENSASVMWAARVDGSSFVIERASKGVHQPPSQVTTSPSEITSLATDGTRVYFTRADGVIASAPASGGAADILASGEADPRSILVDPSSVYWLARATGEVVQMPKTGGARKSLSPPTNRKRGQILRGVDVLLIREEGNLDRNTFLAYSLADGVEIELMPDYGPNSLASFDPLAGIVDFVEGAARFFTENRKDEAILHFSLQADLAGNRWSDFYTGGQSDVIGIASVAGNVIWATNGAAGGTVKRSRR